MTPTDPSSILEEALPGGAMISCVLRRHQRLRLTDVEGGANAAMLLFNRDQLLERYNMPDTLKAQHTALLTSGDVLFTDMGRILCSIVDDTVGWHDPLSGCGNAELVEMKYGEARYQEHRNGFHRNAHDEFLIELAKYGLDIRDMTAPVNFFSKVVVDAAGDMRYASGHSQPGAAVELRAEMHVLVVLNTCQHPLDPNADYEPRPVRVAVHTAAPAGAGDRCRISRPENARGFMLTERYAR
jgi:uncharacterized protein